MRAVRTACHVNTAANPRKAMATVRSASDTTDSIAGRAAPRGAPASCFGHVQVVQRIDRERRRLDRTDDAFRRRAVGIPLPEIALGRQVVAAAVRTEQDLH